MKPKHIYFICAAMIVSVIRLILRTIFVIMAESPLGVPPVIFSLLSFAILVVLQRKGGCNSVILYFLVEPILCTIWWCILVFALDTNNICSNLGDGYCEDIDPMELTFDYVRRPHAWLIALIVPGLIFDVMFMWVFRQPTISPSSMRNPSLEI